MTRIDLNCDLGEGFGRWTLGNDAALLNLVSSANVACGFHAGDPAGLLSVLKQASVRGVAVGAHIAYRDLVGFGRRNMEPSNAELVGDTIYQIGALQGLAKAVGTAVTYVKPHGALYNTISHDARQAAAVIEGILAAGPSLVLLALAGSPIVEQARSEGLTVACEAFGDRAYRADGTLVSRDEAGAVIHDPHAVADRVVSLVEDGRIRSIDGVEVDLQPDSICIHGDTPYAVDVAQSVRRALDTRNIGLEPFAPARSNHA